MITEEDKKFYLSPEGFKKIKKELEKFKKLKALKLGGESPQVQESEDLNPEYLSLQEDLSLIEAKIIELDNVVRNAQIIKKVPKAQQNVVGLGVTVTVEVNGQKQEDEFIIVGSLEADPGAGKISNESPVGKALLKHKVGEQVAVSSPEKTFYKIKKIRY